MKIVKAAVLKDFNQDFEIEELEQAEPEANEVYFPADCHISRKTRLNLTSLFMFFYDILLIGL